MASLLTVLFMALGYMTFKSNMPWYAKAPLIIVLGLLVSVVGNIGGN